MLAFLTVKTCFHSRFNNVTVTVLNSVTNHIVNTTYTRTSHDLPQSGISQVCLFDQCICTHRCY